MEILLINDSKLKVRLSADDMRSFDISLDGMDYDNTETRRVFWEILDRAKKETGFDAARERVFIQVYPAKDGGCDMYVTKQAKKETDIKEIKKYRDKWLLYGFDSYADLECATQKLHRTGIFTKSDAYYEKVGEKYRYYLVLYGFDAPNDRFLFLGEYGKRYTNFAALSYIKEHGELFICDCAAKTLAKLK
ncbi:MAG: adaptor protein MecA [Clostridia bacterium]|nr:adaptor protein MecA [Clostridia bacterium]